jgi:transposase
LRTAATTTTRIVRARGRQAGDRSPQDRARFRAGRVRWVVERTFAHLHHFKRLLVRFDRHAEIHDAFLAIACCLVCFKGWKLV